MVAGHAIWKGGPTLGEVDEEWTLEPYQEGYNESLTWIEHIEQGVELASDASSVLIFSGYVSPGIIGFCLWVLMKVCYT